MKNLKGLVLWALVVIPLAGQAQSKTFTLPTVIVDSMIFEVRKGRECDTALNFALQTIEAKNSLIHGQGKIIELRGKQIENYALLDANWSERMSNLTETHSLDKAKLKAEKKKLRKIIFGESLAIIVLVVLLL